MTNFKKIELISSTEKKWYAVYTRSRFEKKVKNILIENDIETLLPLKKVVRQWSDRKKTIEIPILKSYIFVKINNDDYIRVLEVFGVVKFITYLGITNPAPIPKEQINNLRILTDNNSDLEVVHEKLSAGNKVKVVGGAFNGLKGELIKYHGNKKIVVKINHLNTSILVTVPASQIVKNK